MAEYVPIFECGEAITAQTSAPVTGGRLVGVSGSGTVAHTTAKQASWLGVAAFDAASGARVTVLAGGVQSVENVGGVTAGDILVAAADGKVQKLAAVTTPTAADVTDTRAIVGTALTTGADGALVEFKMER